MNLKRVFSFLLAAGVLLECTVANHSFTESAEAANHARVAVHDPSIVKLEDGSYYIIGSHLGAARSADLGSWTHTANSAAGTKNTTFFNDIYTDLAVPESWSKPSNANYDLSGNLWAPDIVYNEAMGKYCMYLSVNGDFWKSSIVLCTADNIDGPYTYQGTVVYSGFNHSEANNYTKTDVPKVLGSNPDLSRYLDSSGEWNANYGTNAIDPAVFYDENGALWMVYGSWFGGLFMLELDENTGLRDYDVTYSTVKNASDAYMGIQVAGGYWVSGEGAYIEYMEDPDTGVGYYYLFVSYGCFNNDGGYNMRIFRSSSPAGPYVDQNGNSAVYTGPADNIGGTVGMRLMSNYKWNCNDRPNKAQGHNSVLMDDDGKLFVIYHNKFDDAYGFHEVRGITYATYPVEAPGGVLPLKDEYFAIDALIFRNLQSNEVTLRNRETGRGVTVNFGGIETLLIWTKPGAPYVCIEPWCGFPCWEDFNGKLEDKDGMRRIAPGDTYSSTHTITLIP